MTIAAFIATAGLCLLLAGQAVARPAAQPAGHAPVVARSAVRPVAPAVRHAALAAGQRSNCSLPAPATATGYAALWARLPASEWGGADVSLSVPLPGGRIAWLYGDTLSAGHGLVHSTLIVQTGGCLHVSAAGAQLLPNDNPRRVYWIEAAQAGAGGLLVEARAINITGAGAWSFADAGYSRRALVAVDAAGDGRFLRWVATLDRPALPTSPLTLLGPGHYAYGIREHPEVHLADGAELVTTCQNWSDLLHHLADYRPIFSEAVR